MKDIMANFIKDMINELFYVECSIDNRSDCYLFCFNHNGDDLKHFKVCKSQLRITTVISFLKDIMAYVEKELIHKAVRKCDYD